MCITLCDFLDDSARDHERDAALGRGMISTHAPPGASIKSPELNAPHTSQIQDMVNLNGERSKPQNCSRSALSGLWTRQSIGASLTDDLPPVPDKRRAARVKGNSTTKPSGGGMEALCQWPTAAVSVTGFATDIACA